MAVFLPDEIVRNILARLPAKPLLRFRCVSKHWNRMITHPHFMKFRSRKIIILPLRESVRLIDDDVPIDDTSNSILKHCYPREYRRTEARSIFVIGTFSGIVVLYLGYYGTMILYNPLTGTSKELPRPPDYVHDLAHGYGFGYGATQDDLKIVMLKCHVICQVYCFKGNSWSSRKASQHYSRNTRFLYEVGTFLNGFLHWISWNSDVIAVLNLKDMIFSEIDTPFMSDGRTVLGTVDGYLCMLNRRHGCSEIWVMKEHGLEYTWAKTYTFKSPCIDDNKSLYYGWYCQPLSIMDSGRILSVDSSNQVIIYDIHNNSYKTLNIPLRDKSIYWERPNNIGEYVESLVSPSDICVSLRGKRKE